MGCNVLSFTQCAVTWPHTPKCSRDFLFFCFFAPIPSTHTNLDCAICLLLLLSSFLTRKPHLFLCVINNIFTMVSRHPFLCAQGFSSLRTVLCYWLLLFRLLVWPTPCWCGSITLAFTLLLTNSGFFHSTWVFQHYCAFLRCFLVSWGQLLSEECFSSCFPPDCSAPSQGRFCFLWWLIFEKSQCQNHSPTTECGDFICSDDVFGKWLDGVSSQQVGEEASLPNSESLAFILAQPWSLGCWPSFRLLIWWRIMTGAPRLSVSKYNIWFLAIRNTLWFLAIRNTLRIRSLSQLVSEGRLKDRDNRRELENHESFNKRRERESS